MHIEEKLVHTGGLILKQQFVFRARINRYRTHLTQPYMKKLIYTNNNFILIYIQQDATLHSLFYLETALHASGGTYTHHQEVNQLYLQHLLFVTPLLLPAAIVY
jgi:hypothetical protein